MEWSIIPGIMMDGQTMVFLSGVMKSVTTPTLARRKVYKLNRVLATKP